MKKLTELRERAGLSIKQLSELSGISVQNIRCYERGAIQPKVDNILSLVRALDTTPNVLLDFVEYDTFTETDKRMRWYFEDYKRQKVKKPYSVVVQKQFFDFDNPQQARYFQQELFGQGLHVKLVRNK